MAESPEHCRPMALARAAMRKGLVMDFSFASVAADLIISVIRYLIYATNPFSVLFYFALICGVIAFLCDVLRASV